MAQHLSSPLGGRFIEGRLVLSAGDAWAHFVAPCVFLAAGAAFVIMPRGFDRTATTLAGIALVAFGALFLRTQWRRLRIRTLRVDVSPEVLRRSLCAAARLCGWTQAPNQDVRRCDFLAPSGDYKYPQEVRVLLLPGEVQFNSISSLLPGPDAANMELIATAVSRANAEGSIRPPIK